MPYCVSALGTLTEDSTPAGGQAVVVSLLCSRPTRCGAGPTSDWHGSWLDRRPAGGESVCVRECGADLIGKQNRHPKLFDRRANDAGRGREHKLTVNGAALSDDETYVLIRW